MRLSWGPRFPGKKKKHEPYKGWLFLRPARCGSALWPSYFFSMTQKKHVYNPKFMEKMDWIWLNQSQMWRYELRVFFCLSRTWMSRGDRNQSQLGLMIDEENPSKKHLGWQQNTSQFMGHSFYITLLSRISSPSPVANSTDPKKYPPAFFLLFGVFFSWNPGDPVIFPQKKHSHREGSSCHNYPSFQGEDRSGRVFQYISNASESRKNNQKMPTRVFSEARVVFSHFSKARTSNPQRVFCWSNAFPNFVDEKFCLALLLGTGGRAEVFGTICHLLGCQMMTGAPSSPCVLEIRSFQGAGNQELTYT